MNEIEEQIETLPFYPIFAILPSERFVQVSNQIAIPVPLVQVEEVVAKINKIKQRTLFKVCYKGESSFQVVNCDKLSQLFNFTYLTHLNFFHEKVLRHVLHNKPSLFVLKNDEYMLDEKDLQLKFKDEETELNFDYFKQKSFCRHTYQEIISFLENGSLSSNLVIKFIDDTMGYGLFADDLILKGSFIGEYTGLVNTASENNIQIKEISDGESKSYFNPLAYCCEYPSCEGDVLIDAYEFGNVIRFINHSDDPSKSNSNMWRCEDSTGLPHVICVTNFFNFFFLQLLLSHFSFF